MIEKTLFDQWWDVKSWLGMLVATLAISALLGIQQGRSDMKHWQDDYYAAHPVVKEVPIMVGDQALLIDGYTYRNIAVDTYKKTVMGICPIPPVLSGECRHVYSDGMSYTVWPCELPSPKPQKGSKRPVCKSSSCSPVDTITPLRCADGQIVPKDGPCPAQPILEKEPVPLHCAKTWAEFVNTQTSQDSGKCVSVSSDGTYCAAPCTPAEPKPQ